jgi:hypothetical protein
LPLIGQPFFEQFGGDRTYGIAAILIIMLSMVFLGYMMKKMFE